MKKLLLLISMTVCFAVHSAEQEPQTSELHQAIESADLSTVTSLVRRESIDVNAVCDGKTPLILAAEKYCVSLSQGPSPGSMSTEDVRAAEAIAPSTDTNQSKILKLLVNNQRTTITQEDYDQFESNHTDDNGSSDPYSLPPLALLRKKLPKTWCITN